MSDQDGIQPSTKQHRSRKTNPTNQQNGKQAPAAQRPTNDDKEVWKAYWENQGQPWRTDPEIDVERQKYLEGRRNIKPDIEQDIYPFKDIKLNRADVEWLLATHENGRGPVDWNDERQRERKGLDFRGADLQGVNLRFLPLANLDGSLHWRDWKHATEKQRNMAVAHLEEANLGEAHLEGANMRGTWMVKANLAESYLSEASFTEAHLEGADLRADLRKASLWEAHMENANLRSAHLEGANLWKTHLEGADLRGAFFDVATFLNDIILGSKEYGFIKVTDLHWESANLAVVDWTQMKMLGDEYEARQQKDGAGKMKDRQHRLNEYLFAVRANRQLAIALQSQGLNEDAARFAYRAQKLQQVVFRRQRRFGRYFFSDLLDLLAGYGYRPGRSVLWYLAVIFGFALTYFTFGHLPFFPDAFVFSLTSFHGRGFFPGLGSEASLHNPLVILAAFEAVIGLLIEISFIATFTQRFFGK